MTFAIDHKELARTYFKHVNAQASDAIAAMFASDGCATLPNGLQLRGRTAIRTFYQSLFDKGAPAPKLIHVIGDGLFIATEMRVSLADGTEQPAADFFRLDTSGLITELTIYAAELPKTPES